MKYHFLLCLPFIILVSLMSCQSNGTSEKQAAADNTSTTTANAKNNQDGAPLNELIATYDPPDRELWQKPQLVIQKMGDLSKKTVADIGAGSGSFARRLAQVAQKVIAIELDNRFIMYMDSIKRVELSEEYQSRFETRLATPTDSKLNVGEADIILMVNTYMYIADRAAYLQHLIERLPEGGKVVIVDFKKKRIPIRNPSQRLRLPLFEVEKELESAGFNSITSDDRSLDYQYIVMASK